MRDHGNDTAAVTKCKEANIMTCRNCKKQGHVATDPKCPTKIKADAELAAKRRPRSQTRGNRYGPLRSPSGGRTPGQCDAELSDHASQERTTTALPSLPNGAARGQQQRSSNSQPAHVERKRHVSYAAATTTPSQIEETAKTSTSATKEQPPLKGILQEEATIQAELEKLAQEAADLRRRLEETEARHTALLKRLRAARREQPYTGRPPAQEDSATAAMQPTGLAQLLHQLFQPLLQAQEKHYQAQEQHFRRQHELLQRLVTSHA